MPTIDGRTFTATAVAGETLPSAELFTSVVSVFVSSKYIIFSTLFFGNFYIYIEGG